MVGAQRIDVDVDVDVDVQNSHLGSLEQQNPLAGWCRVMHRSTTIEYGFGFAHETLNGFPMFVNSRATYKPICLQ